MVRRIPDPRPRSSLPVEAASFVGRRHELAKIRTLLGNNRLVTLLGVGGVGKTRLALRAAHDLRRAFHDGVYVVNLAGLSDAGLLPQTTAAALGMRDDSPLQPTERLIEQLAERQVLIVLDNCEHLIDDCAMLVDAILCGCPDVRVLATSRTALQIEAECTLPLPPLSVPEAPENPDDPGGIVSAEALLASDAVELFTSRATACYPDFELTEDNAPAVAELCRRLDGIPLALELAAVRIRSLSVRQILDGLSDRYRLLTQGSRTALPRQRTLRSLMDWSYDLLTEEARLLWARVSVFAGSFELDAAEGICPDDALAREDVLDLLAELVDKSVLLRDERDGQARYRLLETIKEYGLNRLRASGELATLRQRHRDWYAGLTAHALTQLEDGEQIEAYHRLRAEQANLRAAFELCTASSDDARLGLRMAADLRHFWIMSGAFSEGRRWLEELLALAPAAPEAVGGLTAAGKLAVLQADVTEGRRLLARARTLATSTGQEMWLAEITHNEGIASLFHGDPATALTHFTESHDAHKKAGNDFGIMVALIQSAAARSLLGETSHALELCEECLEISTRHGDRWCAALAMWTQALLRWHWNEPKRAEALATETLAIKEAFDDRLGMAMAMELIAWVTEQHGQHARAATLLGAVQSAMRSVGATSLFKHLERGHAICEERTRAALGETWQTHVDKGAAMDTESAIDLALRRTAKPVVAHHGARLDDELTGREREIAQLVADGLSNRDIAAKLVISPRTAEKHVEKILTKLGLSSRTQIGVWFATGRQDDPTSSSYSRFHDRHHAVGA
ncbi:ATP-binding protein [Haloechinothrix salitolerans]|uniref:ATP-binding protein n=1 Tax=Haloechinothrix salitolerans TaxID=926830 RepID=A0ABW2BYW2_9PSEU